MKKTMAYALLAIFIMGIVSVGAAAFQWRNGGIESSLESGDYETYLQAFNDSDRPFMRQKLTEEQFQERVVFLQEREQAQAQIAAAMDEGYDAWKAAIDKLGHAPPFADQITAENFGKYVEMHQASERVHELSEELGIQRGRMGGGFPREGCLN